MCEFRVGCLFSCDLRQDANPTHWQCVNFALMTLFLRFTTGRRIPHFYNPFLLQWRPCVISPSAGATLGQRPPSSRIQNARLRPLSSGDLPTASRLQVKASSSVWEQLDPDLVLFGQRDPNTLELRAYRKEPNPETLAFLTLSLGPSHCLPALGCALPAL